MPGPISWPNRIATPPPAAVSRSSSAIASPMRPSATPGPVAIAASSSARPGPSSTAKATLSVISRAPPAASAAASRFAVPSVRSRFVGSNWRSAPRRLICAGIAVARWTSASGRQSRAKRTTASRSSRSSATSPSPAAGAEREKPRTSCPAAASAGSAARPRTPVAPATATRIGPSPHNPSPSRRPSPGRRHPRSSPVAGIPRRIPVPGAPAHSGGRTTLAPTAGPRWPARRPVQSRSSLRRGRAATALGVPARPPRQHDDAGVDRRRIAIRGPARRASRLRPGS